MGAAAEPTRAKTALERICLELLSQADLGRAVPFVKEFERNTMIEVKRAGAFIRLYVSEEVRCSVRMNMPAHKARRDNFPLYAPRENTPESEIRRVLAEDLGLIRTLEAVARVSYDPAADPAWISPHLTAWLERWCDPDAEKLPGKQEKVRISVTMPADDYQALREYAFCKGSSPNKAASELISETMRSWVPGEDEAEMLSRLRSPRPARVGTGS